MVKMTYQEAARVRYRRPTVKPTHQRVSHQQLTLDRGRSLPSAIASSKLGAFVMHAIRIFFTVIEY